MTEKYWNMKMGLIVTEKRFNLETIMDTKVCNKCRSKVLLRIDKEVCMVCV